MLKMVFDLLHLVANLRIYIEVSAFVVKMLLPWLCMV